MVRGTPGIKRDRTISVRVSQAEWAAWEARRATSGRKEMGAWVRAVVLDAAGLGGLGVPGCRAGDVPVVPEVNEQAYAALVGAANNLNQLTRYSHQEEALAAGVEAAMAEVVAAARAVRGRSVTTAVTTAATDPVSGPVSGPVGGPVVPVMESVLEQEPADQPAQQSAVQVDPWVSRPRRRAEQPTADAGVDFGFAARPGSARGAARPLTPNDVQQDVQQEVEEKVQQEAEQRTGRQGERPAGWDTMSLVERTQWMQRWQQ